MRNTRSKYQSIVLMSTPQALSGSKVQVSPSQLEVAKEPPLNTYKPKEPYTATIISVERLVGPKAPGETCHIVIDHGGNVPYWEGQSYRVIPPGENPKKPGDPHNVRLYSIASTRYGDSFDGKTASLCVGRAIIIPRQVKKILLRMVFAATSFTTQSLETVKITGPSGKIMLLPEDDPNATHVMIATGTGVAPYRGYLRRMFMESVPKYRFNGLAWLFLGVANSDSLLYDSEFSKYLEDYPAMRYSNCGLKGMMPGIQDTLKRVAEGRGESWEAKLSQLKKNKQWHVEVY
nr:ferredoxin--NADP reductase, root isozyme, chloroplastic [Tanacetum cinerariifolium]